MVLAAAVHLELLVHGLVFEHEQRGERRHHVHGLREPDDLVLVLGCVFGQEAVDLQLGPGARQVVGVLGDIRDRNVAVPGLAVERAGDGDGFGHRRADAPRSPSRDAGDGADFFALGDRAGVTQEPDALSVVHDVDVQKPRRVEDRGQLERPPLDRLVGIEPRKNALAVGAQQARD